jgi:glycosyltransferase involved in cell wall biosynthesis
MDICVLNPFFYPYTGGTEKVLYEVYKRLAKRHNITAIVAAPEHRDGYTEEIDGIKIVRLKSRYIRMPGLPLPFVAMENIRNAIVKEECSLYHINNRYQFFSNTLRTIKGMDKKLALTIHNAMPKGIDVATDSLGLTYDIVWSRRLMHSADVITGISKNVVETTVPLKERGKTHVVYNGVDFRRFRKLKGSVHTREIAKSLNLDCYTIVTNGRLVPQKGQIYLLKAVSELMDEGHEIGLMIIGTGYLNRYLYRTARRLGMQEKFGIVNGISEEMLPYYYNVGSVFALPSLYEPASLVILEALSCEMPCVASRVGGIPEMMRKCGVYSEPRDVDSIKEGISILLDDRKKSKALAECGRKLMIRLHDWDRISRQYERLFLATAHY